ncbi:MAG: PAS domain-containing protein [bacterium]|nr:PAS domain-containing protein [bacterium]
MEEARTKQQNSETVECENCDALKEDIVALQDSLNSSQVSIFVINKEWHVTFANENLLRLLKYSDDEILNKSIRDTLCNQEECSIALEPALEVAEGVGNFEGELVLQAKENVRVYVWARISHNKEGQQFTFSVWDITVQKKRENELTLFSKRLEYIQQMANIATWERRLDGDHQSWSAGEFILHDIEEGKITPTMTFWYDQIYPADVERVRAGINSLISNEEIVAVEYRIITPTGAQKWVRSHFAVERDTDEVKRLIATSLDITVFKTNELSLTKKVRELEILNRMMIDRELKMIQLKKELAVCMKTASLSAHNK